MSMVLVASSTVGAGGAASIEFTGIPQDGTDLVALLALRQVDTNYSGAYMTVSGSTSGYSVRFLYGQGASVFSNSTSGLAQLNGMPVMSSSTDTANTFSNSSIYMPNYTSSVAKSFSMDGVSENNGTTAFQFINAGIWTGTTAITSMQFTVPFGGSFAEGSTASLYKITKA